MFLFSLDVVILSSLLPARSSRSDTPISQSVPSSGRRGFFSSQYYFARLRVLLLNILVSGRIEILCPDESSRISIFEQVWQFDSMVGDDVPAQ